MTQLTSRDTAVAAPRAVAAEPSLPIETDAVATCVRCGNTDNDGSDECVDCGDEMK